MLRSGKSGVTQKWVEIFITDETFVCKQQNPLKGVPLGSFLLHCGSLRQLLSTPPLSSPPIESTLLDGPRSFAAVHCLEVLLGHRTQFKAEELSGDRFTSLSPLPVSGTSDPGA